MLGLQDSLSKQKSRAAADAPAAEAADAENDGGMSLTRQGSAVVDEVYRDNDEFVLKVMDFVSKMMDFVFKMMNLALIMMTMIRGWRCRRRHQRTMERVMT